MQAQSWAHSPRASEQPLPWLGSSAPRLGRGPCQRGPDLDQVALSILEEGWGRMARLPSPYPANTDRGQPRGESPGAKKGPKRQKRLRQ